MRTVSLGLKTNSYGYGPTQEKIAKLHGWPLEFECESIAFSDTQMQLCLVPMDQGPDQRKFAEKIVELWNDQERIKELEVLVSAADDIAKAFESPGVNNQVWVAIEYYRALRNPK